MTKKAYVGLVLIAIACGAAAGVAAAHMWTRELFADGAEILFSDTDGKLRAILGGGTNGTPLALTLMDASGKIRAFLAERGSGSMVLDLSDENGKIRAAMSLNSEGTPSLFFRDKRGKARVILALGGTEEDAMLRFLDPNGSVVWSAP